MTFRDDILPDIEDIRGIPGEFGIRLFSVWVRVTVSDGRRVGDGAKATTETQLLVNGQNPKVRQTKSKDVVAGTSELQAGEWEVGPLTPGFTTPDVLSPPADGRPTEVVYLLKGPGLPEAGLLCQRVKDSLDRALHYMVTIRSSGRRKPSP